MPPLFQLGLALSVALSVRAQAPAPTPIPEVELLRRLGATGDSLAKLDQFSGTILLTKGGVPVFQRAWGMADRESRRPNTIETAYNLGSINKVFTATAVRQLAAAGRLSLDSPIAVYWPNYPNAEVAKRVTIRQLLQHRSGIGGDIFGTPPHKTRREIRHNRDFLQLFVDAPLQFEPGSREEYSNAGYVLLGLLVERVSGEDYYEYVHRHIYLPAGMTHTAHYPSDSLPLVAARGYTRGGEDAPLDAPLRRNLDELPGRGSAAGGGYSTVQDLAQFLQALREHRIPGGPEAGIGAAGGTGGVNALIEGGLPGGYDLIVLANLDPPAAMRIGRMVRSWLGAKDD